MGYTRFSGLRSCKKSSGQWPLISASINYFNSDESFAALISNISTMTEVNADIEGIPVDITTNDGEVIRDASTVIDGQFHLGNTVFDPSNNVYGYAIESLNYYAIKTYKVEQPNYLAEMTNADYAYILLSADEFTHQLN